MARKTVGYVRTEWTCPNCQTRNPGPQKTCTSCGMPQPDDVKFEQAAHEELITAEDELKKAKAGPDVHCYYCGSRNPAGATNCSQCGADLTEGTARQSGQVLGARRQGPAQKITCSACGAENEANAPKCAQCGASLARPEAEPKTRPEVQPAATRRIGLFGGIGLAVLLLLCVAGIVFMVLSRRTEDIRGTVSGVTWTRTIAIEALQPVEHEAWQDDIPAEAVMGVCTQKVHHTQSDPAPNAREVCGTPYSVDKGSGYAEVVQDCEYEVFADWCKYTVDEWRQVDEVSQSGNDLNPHWPPVSALNQNQREGERSEDYEVIFNAEDGQYTYHPDSEAEFDDYQIGSRWILKVNTFNAVLETEPMR
ncbi:MAG: zinc ribbon domain-containing protein [Anaerolineae bacterium]|nr:zinc ribbon domain-containing protein [Anaerolineae bacterium]